MTEYIFTIRYDGTFYRVYQKNQRLRFSHWFPTEEFYTELDDAEKELDRLKSEFKSYNIYE